MNDYDKAKLKYQERIKDMSKEDAIKLIDDLLWNFDMKDFQTSEDRTNIVALQRLMKDLEATDE